jgi:hypothetical protein
MTRASIGAGKSDVLIFFDVLSDGADLSKSIKEFQAKNSKR